MSLLDRRILSGFAARMAAILVSLTVLSALVSLRRLARKGSNSLLDATADLVMSLEAALIVAAPLAMLLTILRLKKAGILTACFGAGLHPAQLRRCFLLAGMATVLLSTLAASATGWTRQGREGGPIIWRTNGHYVWHPPGHGQEVLLFNDESLDVQRVSDAPEMLRPPLPPPQQRSETLFPPPSVGAWLSGDATPTMILAALNRIFFAAVLMLICSYIALILPIRRQSLAFFVLPCLLPILGTGGLLLATLLWEGGWQGCVAEGASIFAIASVIVALDRIFQKRGLRLSG